MHRNWPPHRAWACSVSPFPCVQDIATDCKAHELPASWPHCQCSLTPAEGLLNTPWSFWDGFPVWTNMSELDWNLSPRYLDCGETLVFLLTSCAYHHHTAFGPLLPSGCLLSIHTQVLLTSQCICWCYRCTYLGAAVSWTRVTLKSASLIFAPLLL